MNTPRRLTRWIARLTSLLAFAAATLPANAAEPITDESTRLQVLRLFFPDKKITVVQAQAKPESPESAQWLDPIAPALKSALDGQREYDVVGPVSTEEKEPAEDISTSTVSERRRVRFLVFRWRHEAQNQSNLVAIVNYSFPEASPARCCRAIGKIALLSNDAKTILSVIDEMPNAFTTFTCVRFLRLGRTASTENLLVGADFAGAFTTGVSTVVLDLSHQRLIPLLWLSTTVYWGMEKKDEEMYSMTVDEKRTLLSTERRIWFTRRTYMKHGRKFLRPVITQESVRVGTKGVKLDWL